jgi:hypothetical protein
VTARHRAVTKKTKTGIPNQKDELRVTSVVIAGVMRRSQGRAALKEKGPGVFSPGAQDLKTLRP